LHIGAYKKRKAVEDRKFCNTTGRVVHACLTSSGILSLASLGGIRSKHANLWI
jgi:hypothetical protein